MNAKTIRERTEALKAQIQQQGDISYTDNRKNTGSGTLYALEKLGLGFMRSVEGITDYVVGGIGDLFGADEFAENLMKNDWVNYSHADEWYNPGKGWSFVGDVVGGIGNMLPSIGLSFVPGAGGAVAAALSTGQFIGSAMGQSTSDAVKQTGDLSGKEWLYGTASGALEGVIEKISGGIAGTAPGKFLGKQLAKTAGGKVASAFIGEGLEEVASDIIDPALKLGTGLADTYEAPTAKELARTFAVGGATGAVMGGGKTLLKAAVNGGFNNAAAVDNATELEENLAKNNVQQAEEAKPTYTQEEIDAKKESLSKNLQKMDEKKRASILQRFPRIASFFNLDGTLKVFTAGNDEMQNLGDSAPQNKNLATDGARYSIQKSVGGKDVVVTDKDILDGIPKKNWVNAVKNEIKKFNSGIPISGKLVKVNAQTASEYTNSKNTQYYKNNNQIIYKDKLNAANNLDEIVLATTNYVNEDLNHARKDNIREFARGDVLMEIGGRKYNANVIVGFTTGQNMLLYDVIDFTPAEFELRQEEKARFPENRSSQQMETMPSTSSIRDKTENVNTFEEKSFEKDSQTVGKLNKDAYSSSLKGRESEFLYEPVSSETMPTETAKRIMKTLTKLTKGKANIVLTGEKMITSDGQTANGVYKDGIIYLDANATDYDKIKVVGAHEVIHTLEGTKAYHDLAKYVAETISNDPALQEKYRYEKYRAVYDSILQGDWSETTKDYQASTEIFADYLANEVLSNEDILNRLGKRKDKGVLGTILGKLFEWIKDAIDRFGMTELELEAKRVLRNMERKLGKALDAGRGGVSLETVERNAREAERTKEQAVAKNATLALARAKINIDNKGKTSYNKKRSYYSQFNTLATSWASKAEKGELFAGYDGNSYRIVIATGDDYLYENYKTVDANNDALIEYYEEFIKENNEKIRSHRNANSVFESIEEFDAVKGRNNRYSLDVARRQPNDRDGGIYQEQSQRNGERNTEESSRNQRGVKSSSRASLTVDKYTEKQYNDFGWARANNVLTARENADFKAKYARIKSGQLRANRTKNGEIIVAVNDGKGDAFGVDNTLVYAKGPLDNYKITKVVKINLDDETSIDIVRSEIYEREKSWARTSDFYADLYEEELVREYTAETFPSYQEIKRAERKRGGGRESAGIDEFDQREQNGRRIAEKTSRYSLDVNSSKSQREAAWTSLLSRYVHRLNLTKDVKAHVVELYGKEVANRIFSVWENTSSKGGVELITAHRELERDGFRTYAQSPADFLGDMDTTLRNIALKTYEAAERGEEVARQEVSTKNHQKDLTKSAEEIELSGRQVQQVAKYTKQKVYSKQDAEIIVNNLLNGYMNYEDEVGSLSGKSRKQVVQMLWEGMNKAAPGQKTKIAMKVADYLIQHTVMENIRNDSMVQMHSDTIDALTPYLHKLNLDNIKEDLRYHFGDNSPYLRWGKRNGEKGIGIDVAAMELTEKGFYIEEINNVDILLRINELYQTAINGIKQKSKRYVNEVLDEGSQKALKQDVAKAVLRAFDAHGSESELTKVLREYDQRVQNWKEKYYEERDRNYLTSNVLYKVQQLKDIERGTFANASEFKNNIFKKSIGLLSRIKYRGNLNKSGTRKILGSLLEWYVPENPVLEGEVYNDEIAKMLMQLADNTKPLTAEQYDLLAELEEKSGLKSFDKLKEWYTRENLGNQYSKVVKAWLNSLADATEFTADELRALGNVVDYFKNFIEKYNKVYRNGKLVEALPLAEKYIKQLQQHKRTKMGWIRKPFEKYMRTFADPMTVARYYDGYEDGFFTETIEMLREGAIAAVEMEQNLQAPLEAFYQKYKKFLKESYDRTIEYQGEKMSIQQAMLLYMTLKRDQAIRGLAYSGFKYRRENETVSIKGFATEENLDIDSLRTLALQEQETISRQFNDAEREYISIVEKIFNEDCKKAKSETDILRQGYTNISDGYYVPIRRASIAQNVEKWTYKDELVTVGEFSFNKDTVTGAKNQLFIDSLTDVLSKHVGGISQYSNLAIALDSYNILYNLNISGNPNIAVNVKSESENVWQEGGQYIGELIDDIKGKSKSKGSGQKFIRQIRSGYAKYQLGANPKVWVTQLSSFAAATNILDIDSIVRGFGVNAKGEVVDEYCSLAKIRNNENSAALAQGVIEKTGKIGDILMKPIGAVDRWVVRRLFAACQVQVAKGGGAKLGTKDNLTKAGELLTRVILETQQNALATERSAAMRSGNEIMKSFTMFSADSMKVLGRVVDGVGEVATLRTKIRLETDSKVKAQLKEQLATANKKASRAISALIASALFMASIALGFKWLYNKDDKDEEVVKNLTVDAIGNLFGGLPFIRDVYSFFSDGYEVQNFAYVAFNDLLDSVTIVKDLSNSLIEGKEVDRRELIRSIRKLTYSSGQILGIPTRNMYNVAYGLTKRLSPETAYKWNDAFYKASYKSDLAKAIENEDDEMISTIVGLMLNENVGGIEDETTREVMDSLVTSGYNIIPKSVPDEITYKENEETVKMSLTKKQKDSFAKAYYTAKEAAARLVQSAQFNKLGQEEQAATLKLIYNSYYDFAVDNCLERDSTNKNVLFMSAFELSTFAVILAQIKSIAADTNKQGKAISGSRKAKIIKYIESLRLTAAQKYMILGYLGYKNTKGEEVVRKYINGLNLSKTEKESLFAYCGYDS